MMPKTRNRETQAIRSGAVSLTGVLLLAIAPLAVVALAAPQALSIMLLGASSWAVAVASKFILQKNKSVRALTGKGAWGAATWGTVSGGLELGCFAMLVNFGLVPSDIWSAAFAGIAISSSEIVFVLAQGVLEDLKKPDPSRYNSWLRGAKRSWWVANMVLVERLSASLLHIGSRMIVALSFHDYLWPLMTIALMSFTIVDGMAIFGIRHDWNWFNPVRCKCFYRIVLGVGVLTLVWHPL